jgi:hypothetical protein
MHGYKIIGWAGALILAVGIFMPARLAGMARYISFFTDRQDNALILLALVAVAMLLLYVEDFSKLLPFALILFLTIGWAYQQRGPNLRTPEHSMQAITATANSLPLVRSLSDSISANSMWWIMFAGGALLILASMVAPRKS